MKRMFYSLLCLVVALFTTTAYAQGSGGTQTLPYTAYFTDGQGDWTTLANNEGTPNWEFGTNGAYFTNWNGTTASDDYLISPYFALYEATTACLRLSDNVIGKQSRLTATIPTLISGILFISFFLLFFNSFSIWKIRQILI